MSEREKGKRMDGWMEERTHMTELIVVLRILRTLLIQTVENEGNKANLTHVYGMERNITVVIVTDIIIIIIIIIIVQGKVIPVHAMKAYGRIGGIAPLLFNLATKWKLVVNITLRERTPVPIA